MKRILITTIIIVLTFSLGAFLVPSFATGTVAQENKPYSCFQGKKIRETRLTNRYAFYEFEGKIFYYHADFARSMIGLSPILYTLTGANLGICNISTYDPDKAKELNPQVCGIELSGKLKRLSVRMREKDFKRVLSCLIE